jgi:lipoprotein-releasing system permease protein
MNWPLFIAKRFLAKEKKSLARRIVLLSILAVALSVATVLISIFALQGFQQTIGQRVSQLQGDYIIDDAANVEGAEWKPISNRYASMVDSAVSSSGLDWELDAVAQRACIAKSDSEVEGVLALGMSFAAIERLSNLKIRDQEGVYMSKTLASRMNVHQGDKLTLLFFSDTQDSLRSRARRYSVLGLLSQGLDEFDQHTLIIPMPALQAMMPAGASQNRWELRAPVEANTEQIEESVRYIQSILPAGLLRISSVESQNRALFDWLMILDTNVWVMLLLMVSVAAIALSTTLLILILDQTSLVGLLQAMGAQRAGIQRVFWWQGLVIASLGLLVGNATAVGLAWAQNAFQWIRLDAEQYYIDSVVFAIDPSTLLIVNGSALGLCMLLMLLPLRFVRRMSLIIAIRYE